jgi:hypothetical protein
MPYLQQVAAIVHLDGHCTPYSNPCGRVIVQKLNRNLTVPALHAFLPAKRAVLGSVVGTRRFCGYFLQILDTDFSKVFAVLIMVRCALGAIGNGRLAAH